MQEAVSSASKFFKKNIHTIRINIWHQKGKTLAISWIKA
jgi:hypothetical protein